MELEFFLNRLPDITALVVGDLMLDEYLWGEAGRISPEAPVPVVNILREELRLGGAGNVVNNLRTLGVDVEVAGAVGEDADGLRLRERLLALGGTDTGVVTVPGRCTGRKTRVLADHQQMLRVDRESVVPIPEAAEEQLLRFLRERLPHCQVLLLSDYGKGVLTKNVLTSAIRMAREAGKPVLVDPKGGDFGKYRGATLLTPNRKELMQAVGGLPVSDEALRSAGRKLTAELELEALVLTRSEEGMTIFFRSGGELDIPTQALEVYDVSGAGDTVLAVLGAALGAGLAVSDAAFLANLAAGVVVGKVGTSVVAPEELRAAARRRSGEEAKIVPRSALPAIRETVHHRGGRVVFTNGCFDLLHIGHVQYLQQARGLGDVLVLGLNSDDSVRRLKGASRPLISADERARILAALGCVDYVTVFDEDTPLELIGALRPDILVKGGDYTAEQVVGRDLVESYGGRVAIIPFVAGHSTTELIRRILRNGEDRSAKS